MARTFNGSTDVLVLSPGAATSFNGAHSVLMLVNPTSVSPPADECYWAALGGAETIAGLFHWTDNQIDLGSDSNGDSVWPMGVTAGAWQWIGHTKASGTVAVKLHRNVIGSTTFAHTTASGTFANDTSTITSYTIGAASSGAAAARDCNVAVFAVWARQLSDTEVELATLSLTHLLALAPTLLVVLDQATTSMKVLDLTGGGGNESSKTGTSVSTISVPEFGYGVPVATPTFGASSGAQTITPGFISAGSQLFSPTFAFGAVTVTPGTIAAGSQLFAPTLTSNFNLAPARIDSTAQLFAPTLTPGAVTVTPGTIASTEQVFAPSLGGGVTVTPGHLASTEQVFAPTFAAGAITVTPGFLASGAQVFQPTLLGGDVAIPRGQRPTLGVG